MIETFAALPASTVVLATVIMAAGSALQAAFGMGLALLVVPLLALLDVRFVPGPMLFASIGLCFAMAHAGRGKIRGREIGVAAIGLLAGTAIGGGALLFIPSGALPRVFGALICAAVLVSVLGVTLRATPPALLGGGTAAGIMGAMVGIHGPPMALVFQHDEPERTRAMLGAFFALAYPLSILGMMPAGFFGLRELALGLALIPGVAIGYGLAPLVARRIDRKRLRIGILAISAASGVVLLLR